MNKRSWETWVFSTAGVVAMFGVLLGVNVVTARFKQRIDLTAEKAYTLSPGTRAVLSRLDTPVTVRFYCSHLETATPETVFLRNYARRVEDLLEEFREAARGKLRIEKLDPQPDSDAEDSARLDNIEPQMLATGDRFYLGLAVSQLDARVAIPFLAPTRERLLEYDILRAISRVIKPEKPVVGIMSPLPVFGGPGATLPMQMGPRNQEPWAAVSELQADFNVRRVEMTAEKIDDDIQVLVVIHPRDITEKTQFAIDQFLMRGGKLVAFLDPVSLADSRQQGNLPFAMPGAPSNLEKLLNAWGLRFDTTKVVADLNFKMQLLGSRNQPVEAPAFLAVSRLGMDPEDPVTSELGTLWLPLCGAFAGTPAEGLKQTVLLKSTPESQLVEAFTAHMSGENILREFRSSGKEHPLAIRLSGRFKTAFPEGLPGSTNGAPALKESQTDTVVVLIGDSDLLFDRFAIRELNSPFGILRMPANANLTFLQNVVEQLAGDVNLIAVRSRALPSRPFTRIQKMQAAAQERYQAEIKKLEDSLAETQRRLNELQQQKEPGQRFILSPEQQAEIARFREREARTREELKRVRKEFRREIDALQTRVQWMNILAMPLFVSLSGVAIALYRRKRTSAK
ncbi:MAG: Gldg family protein [Verrucomicrobiota bacterium]|nr:GldG family protein [Limisphaera sp.]MDW8383086.1 Gldg family protein [Verrucomicrobiota bacterium]